MMRQFFCTFMSLVILLSVTACGNAQDRTNPVTEFSEDIQETSILDTDGKGDMESDMETENDTESNTKKEAGNKGEGEYAQGTTSNTNKEETEMTINIQIGEHLLAAELVQNSSTEALLEMLADGPVTIEMRDYGNMEKVGSLPDSLPRNDESISTNAGDLILYQGDSFVIYYDTNSWSLTRLGKMKDITKEELKDILGNGDVTVVLSLPRE